MIWKWALMVYLEEKTLTSKITDGKAIFISCNIWKFKMLEQRKFGGEGRMRRGRGRERRMEGAKRVHFCSLLPNENSFTVIDILCLTRLHRIDEIPFLEMWANLVEFHLATTSCTADPITFLSNENNRKEIRCGGSMVDHFSIPCWLPFHTFKRKFCSSDGQNICLTLWISNICTKIRQWHMWAKFHLAWSMARPNITVCDFNLS